MKIINFLTLIMICLGLSSCSKEIQENMEYNSNSLTNDIMRKSETIGCIKALIYLSKTNKFKESKPELINFCRNKVHNYEQ